MDRLEHRLEQGGLGEAAADRVAPIGDFDRDRRRARGEQLEMLPIAPVERIVQDILLRQRRGRVVAEADARDVGRPAPFERHHRRIDRELRRDRDADARPARAAVMQRREPAHARSVGDDLRIAARGGADRRQGVREFVILIPLIIAADDVDRIDPARAEEGLAEAGALQRAMIGVRIERDVADPALAGCDLPDEQIVRCEQDMVAERLVAEVGVQSCKHHVHDSRSPRLTSPSSCNRPPTSFSRPASGHALGPSDNALAGSGCVSMNRPDIPTATAARASTGT